MKKAAEEMKFDVDATQLKTLAACVVAYQCFKFFIGLQEDIDINEMYEDFEFVIRTLPTNTEISDTERAIEFLQSFYVTNYRNFAHEAERPDFNNEYISPTAQIYGKDFKNGEVAFVTEVLKDALEKDGKFKSADKLLAEFKDAGYLVCTKNRRTVTTWINGKPAPTCRFIAGIITTGQQESEEDETTA